MSHLKLAHRLAAGILAAATLTSSWAATQYTYDELNRLTQVRYDDGRSISYTYDAAGNMLSVVHAGGGIALFSDDFSGPALDLTKWQVDRCQPDYNGAPATYAVEAGALSITVPGGTDGAGGKCSGSKFVAKTGPIAGDFEVTVKVSETSRVPFPGQRDNSGVHLYYGRTYIGVTGNYSGYWWGYPYASYNKHRVSGASPTSVSAPCLVDESLGLNTMYTMQLRIRRASGVGYVAYRMDGASDWTERTCALDASGEIHILAWSGDGGGTTRTGRFTGTVDDVVIRRP